jgi:hypothetical protein
VNGWGVRHFWSMLGLVFLLLWLPFFALVPLVGPQWAVYPALAVWGATLVVCLAWFKRYPVRVFLLGFGVVLLWHLFGFAFQALGWRP